MLAAVPRRWYDEDLMLAIGRHHLDWGSVDQPPLAPVLARLMDVIAPGSQIALSLPGVLATVAAVVLTALMARELGGDARAQTLAALGQGTCVSAAQFGHWLTPYTLEPGLWAAIFWLLLRWIRVRDDRLLLGLGVVVGVTAQTRFQVLALAIVVVAAVALVGPRTLLRRPLFWAGAAVAVLIAAPTLAWQAGNGWPQLGMAAVVAAENPVIYGHPLLIVPAGLATVGLMGLGLAVCGLVALARDDRWRDQRFVGVAFVLLYVGVLIGSGRHYYTAAAYPVLVAIGAVALQHRREAGRARRAWPWVAVSAVLALGVAGSSLLLASPAFADPLVATTARVYDDLPADERERTALVTGPYVYAAHLDAAPPELGLPPVSSTNRAYGWFPPPPEHQDRMLFVGDPVAMEPFFTGIRPVARVGATTPIAVYSGLVDAEPTLWLLDGRTTPWSTIWRTLRDLTLP